MKQLSGAIIPAVTPFDKDGTLRLDWLQENYARWNKTKVNGVMALGSNGEFRSLSDDESFEVIKLAAETISKGKSLIAGIGRESLFQTLAFLKRLEAAALDIDYVSILTPGYFKNAMTDQALVDYYRTVADQSPYPVLLYCAPRFANHVCISPQALQVLAEHPNIAGIKDTSDDMMSTYMSAAGGLSDFSVIAGSLRNVMSCLEKGGTAGVISAANYFPNACAKLFAIAKTEGLEAARVYHGQLQALVSQTGGRASVASVKAAMEAMGYRGGYPRLPFQPCAPAVADEIRQCVLSDQTLLSEDI